MIKLENTEVSGFPAAIRGMRNPMNSWDKSDSGYGCLGKEGPLSCQDGCAYRRDCWMDGMGSFKVGDADLKLMKQLIQAGTDHSKFMRMINVTVDVTAPMYWWKEADTYKVGTVRNSCSTMHKIQAKEFTLDDFSQEHLDENGICAFMEDKVIIDTSAYYVFCELIAVLNAYRDMYNDTKDKKWWWQLIQLLPSSYNQRATLQLNYAVLRNIYRSRKDHKLDEWHDFCHWIEELPCSELITL